ncbi:MAG: IPTL-CTERM sorting domain-containing protein [Ketobacter sp.]|nr:IPTL-CTERM sorting domain-containing protein [Ketobacter sp.]
MHGSFNHPAANGVLAVDGPLSSVAIDRNRNLTAEPGTSLYVVALPESVHANVATIGGVVRNPNPADVNFNLQFDAPVGVTAITAKVIAAAHARTLSGEDFYLPVFPCVSSMAAAPALTVPLPPPGSSDIIDLSIAASVLGCNGEVFDIAGIGIPSAPSATAIPLLGPWGLVSLVAILGTLVGWCQRRRS